MDKTITLTGQLEQFYAELQVQEKEAKKDQFVLLSLVIAGMIGVYSLINFGNNEIQLKGNTPSATKIEGVQPEPAQSTALMDL